jgi:D-alanyl-D-alanine carboxypeptidase
MQWVAKRHLIVAAIFLSIACATLTALAVGKISLEPDLPPTLTCFEKSTATFRVYLAQECPAGLINLGNSAIAESATASGLVTEIHPLLLKRFEAARSAALLEGVHLYISSGFRTYERQAELFAAEVIARGSESEAAKWVLPPHFSHHPQGLAMDINYPGDRPGAKWLEVNGSRFGLCRVYANEWWHFEGVIAPGESCPALAPNALVDLG